MDETQIAQEEKKANSNTKWILIIAGVGCALLACAALVIALAVAMFFPVTRRVTSVSTEQLEGPPQAVEVTVEPQPLGDIFIPETRDYPMADGNKMGDPNAPVKIIIYSDFQCVYCMNYWSETEPQLIDQYIATGQVYYEYRSFGDFLGPQSALAAEAAYCASDQGKFWPYHDILFLNWSGEGSGNLSPDRLSGFAEALGLDVKAFSTCLENGTYTSRVEEDVSNAQADGIHATPSFLINGELLEGAQPFNIFESKIEAALGNQ